MRIFRLPNTETCLGSFALYPWVLTDMAGRYERYGSWEECLDAL